MYEKQRPLRNEIPFCNRFSLTLTLTKLKTTFYVIFFRLNRTKQAVMPLLRLCLRFRFHNARPYGNRPFYLCLALKWKHWDGKSWIFY